MVGGRPALSVKLCASWPAWVWAPQTTITFLEQLGGGADCPYYWESEAPIRNGSMLSIKSATISAGNNRIQVPRSLNQCCALDSYLETMLLTRPSKNVYRQHWSLTDITAPSARQRHSDAKPRPAKGT